MFNILLHPCPPLHLGTGPPWATSSSPWSTPLPPSAPSSSSSSYSSSSLPCSACRSLGGGSPTRSPAAPSTPSSSPVSPSSRREGFVCACPPPPLPLTFIPLTLLLPINPFRYTLSSFCMFLHKRDFKLDFSVIGSESLTLSVCPSVGWSVGLS